MIFQTVSLKEAADLQAWKEKYASYMQKQQSCSPPPAPAADHLSHSLTENQERLLGLLGQSGDLVVRDFLLPFK